MTALERGAFGYRVTTDRGIWNAANVVIATGDCAEPFVPELGAPLPAFMDSLVAEGFVARGGPLEGTRDALLVIQAEDSSEIVQRLSADPWTRNGLLILKECWPWRIRRSLG